MNEDEQAIRNLREFDLDYGYWVDDAHGDAMLLIRHVKERERLLRNLLAVIHEDGGHYISEHGWEKACEDAMVRAAAEKAEITTAEAFGVLAKALQDDEGYAWGWHCNLAMAAFDQGVDHVTANKAAAAFMKLCFGVETKEPQVMGGEQVAPLEGHDFERTLGEGG